MNLHHQIQEQSKCFPCVPSCVSCLSASDLSCSGGNCQRGYYYNITVQQCVQCPPLCQQCQNGTECLKCISGFYKNSERGQCFQCQQGAETCTYSSTLKCMIGYYYDAKSFLCKKCIKNCLKCDQRQACLQCIQGFRVSPITTSTGTAQYCLPCSVQYCAKCFSNVSTCNSCITGYKLYSNNYCSKYNCSISNCSQCVGPNDPCTLCQEKYILIQGKCYFGASLLCGHAENNTDYGSCVKCKQSGLVKSQLADRTFSYCIPKIPTQKQIFVNYHVFVQNILCTNPYLTSSNFLSRHNFSIQIPPSHTLSLQMSVLLQDTDNEQLQNKVQVIIQGLQAVLIQEQQSSYQWISSQLYCLQLGDHKYKIGTLIKRFKITKIIDYQKYSAFTNQIQIQIVSSITTNLSLSIKQISIQCQKCLSSYCIACLSSSSCVQCQQPYFIQESICVKECDVGFYNNMQTRSCQLRCQPNFYLDNLQSKCLKCSDQCLQCEGNPIYCLSCTNGYYLQSQISQNQQVIRKCVRQCQKDQLYQNSYTGLCEKCLSPCKTCTYGNNSLKCTSCKNGYLYNGSCILQCPAKYYASSVIVAINNRSTSILYCSICADQCATCLVANTTCLSCLSGLYLFNNTCLIECPHGYYQDKLNKMCEKCVNPCRACQGPYFNNCKSCNYGYFKTIKGNVGICVNQCPQYRYFLNKSQETINSYDDSWGFCQKCSDRNCLKCNQITIDGVYRQICLQCQSIDSQTNQNIFLQNNQCVYKCSNGWGDNNQCQACVYPCIICINSQQCQQCSQGYYLMQMIQQRNISNNKNTSNMTENKKFRYVCTLRCPLGTYPSPQSSQIAKCLVCPENCIRCIQSTYCLQCNPLSYSLYLNSCVPKLSCPSGTYFQYQKNECLLCDENCKQCRYNPRYCTQCNDNMYLQPIQYVNKSRCVASCRIGYYESLSTCEPCSPECYLCEIQSNNCTSCSPGLYLHSEGMLSKCINFSQCEDMVTHYPSNRDMVCLKCRSPCQQCSTSFVCYKCKDNWYLFNNRCLGACPQGYYASNNICNYCDFSCETCQNTANKCITCKQGYYLFQSNISYINNSLCQSECPSAFYADSYTHTCQPCKYPCLQCQQLLLCTVCQYSLVYHNSQCLQTCPSNYFLQLNNNKKTCTLCPTGCSSCQIVSLQTVCKSCQHQYFLFRANNSSQCLISCPFMYYAEYSENQCVPCKSPCFECIQQFICSSCVQGYSFKGNACYASCPIGTYVSNASSSLKCLLCDSLCAHCTSTSNCLICKQNTYMLINNDEQKTVCLSDCPMSFFIQSDNTCQLCSLNCLNCSNSKTNCISCKSPKLLQNSRCVTECEQFYYLARAQWGQYCELCGDLCLQCVMATKCLKCFSSYLLITQTEPQKYGHCVYQCPVSTFNNAEEFLCQKCQEGCISCKSSQFCEQCAKNESYTLLNIKCIKLPCPNFTYYYQELNICIDDCWKNGLLLYEEKNLCVRDSKQVNQGCAKYGLLKRQKNCIQICPKGEYVSQDLLCVKGSSDNFFVVEAFRRINGEIRVLIRFKAYLRTKIAIKQQWYKLFIKGVSIKVYNNDQFQAATGLVNRLTTKVEYVKTDLEDALVLAVTFPNISRQLNKTTNDLQVTVQIIEPYSQEIVFSPDINGKRLLQSQRIPLQNKKYSLIVYNTIIEQQNQSPSTQYLSILMMLTAIIFSGVFIMKIKQKAYLLFHLWDYLQLLYILSYVSVQWPAVLAKYLSYFAIIELRWFTFNGIDRFLSESIEPSPQAYYNNSYHISIFQSTAINLSVIVIVALLMLASTMSKQLSCLRGEVLTKIYNNKRTIILVTFFIVHTNIYLYSCINLFYTSSISQDRQFTFSLFFSALIFAVTACIVLTLIYQQDKYSELLDTKISPLVRKDSRLLDDGINPLKKKIVVLLPIHFLIRKLMIILFLTIYPHNSAYSICFGLISTIFLLILIAWYEPFINKHRYRATIVTESSKIVLLLFVFIYILNPEIDPRFCIVILVISFLVFCTIFLYPAWYLYIFWKTSKCEESEKNLLGVPIYAQVLNDKGLQKQISELDSQNQAKQPSSCSIPKELKNPINTDEQIRYKKPLQVQKDQYFQYPSDGQADISNQQDSMISKALEDDKILRLAEKISPKYRQFKNYDIEDIYQIDHDLAEKQIQIKRMIQLAIQKQQQGTANNNNLKQKQEIANNNNLKQKQEIANNNSLEQKQEIANNNSLEQKQEIANTTAQNKNKQITQ